MFYLALALFPVSQNKNSIANLPSEMRNIHVIAAGLQFYAFSVFIYQLCQHVYTDSANIINMPRMMNDGSRLHDESC